MERTEEQPDRLYWTAYDHFMVEREARARRRRYARATIGRFVLRIVRRMRKAWAGTRTAAAVDRVPSARTAA